MSACYNTFVILERKIELDEFKETMNLVMAKISSFESHDTSMTEIDSARGTATVPTPLRHHQVGQTGKALFTLG